MRLEITRVQFFRAVKSKLFNRNTESRESIVTAIIGGATAHSFVRFYSQEQATIVANAENPD